MPRLVIAMKPNVSTRAITSTNAGVIDVHVFEPAVPPAAVRGTIVTVHPWSTLGGGEHNTIGVARHVTRSRSEREGSSWRVITFTLKSSPVWKGGALWGICSNHSYEVQQIEDVVRWARDEYGAGRIVLLGSSAGAPMAGTAMATLSKQQGQQPDRDDAMISACIFIGYTFGNFASIAFGRHFSSVVASPVPQLFVMGERDEFTTVEQLEQMVQKMKANSNERIADIEIVPNVGHFELESPGYDPLVAKISLEWLDKILT